MHQLSEFRVGTKVKWFNNPPSHIYNGIVKSVTPVVVSWVFDKSTGYRAGVADHDETFTEENHHNLSFVHIVSHPRSKVIIICK